MLHCPYIPFFCLCKWSEPPKTGAKTCRKENWPRLRLRPYQGQWVNAAWAADSVVQQSTPHLAMESRISSAEWKPIIATAGSPQVQL